MNPQQQHLKYLRATRTRACNIALRSVHTLLTDHAKWAITGELVGPDYQGLPSWWPFWSDVLVSNVRDAVRAARALEKAEAEIEGREPRI